MQVAEKLKALVEERGITYTFIAERTGIPVDAISKSLRGKRRLPADEMVAICKLMGVDLRDLAGSGSANRTGTPGEGGGPLE